MNPRNALPGLRNGRTIRPQPVAQIFNLPYRRFSNRRAARTTPVLDKLERLRTSPAPPTGKSAIRQAGKPALLALCAALVLAGCSSSTPHPWLAHFIDGYPPKPKQKRSAVTPAPQPDPPGRSLTAPPEPEPVSVHAPYREHKCRSCHESSYSQKLSCAVPELCLGCHEGFLAKAAFRHAPAESGECTLCHAPHDANVRALLLKADPALCHDCHDAADTARVAAHRDTAQRSCTACHDPHRGDNRLFLRTNTVARAGAAVGASVP
ncbi:MAG: hypothetical protein HZA90_10265 [Verrucomicrobia bacterium]|nr:hypothetical protein [Verrucomicrobiota bacterium]